MQSIQSIPLYFRKKLLRAATPKHQPPGTKPRGGPFHKDETLPPLVDALQRELTEGTNGSATRRREAADRHRRRQGRVGAEEAAARQAPLLVLPPEPASRHLSACLSPTAGSRPALQTRSGPRAPPPAPAPHIFRWASCLDKRERECKR